MVLPYTAWMSRLHNLSDATSDASFLFYFKGTPNTVIASLELVSHFQLKPKEPVLPYAITDYPPITAGAYDYIRSLIPSEPGL